MSDELRALANRCEVLERRQIKLLDRLTAVALLVEEIHGRRIAALEEQVVSVHGALVATVANADAVKDMLNDHEARTAALEERLHLIEGDNK